MTSIWGGKKKEMYTPHVGGVVVMSKAKAIIRTTCTSDIDMGHS